MTFTPAPWKHAGVGSIWTGSKIDGDYKAVCQKVCNMDDAKLIAAAPDLLEALQDAYQTCGMGAYEKGTQGYALAKKIRSVLADVEA